MMRDLISKMSISTDGFVAAADGGQDWVMTTGSPDGRTRTVERMSDASLQIMGGRRFRDMAGFWPVTFAAVCAALATVSAAPAAFAGDLVVAKLAQPVTQATKVIAGDAVFACEGDACVANAPTSQTFTSSACKIIAAKLGPLTSFTSGKAMDDTRLAACNSVAVARAAGGATTPKP
jgi:hypothetical protein